MSAEKTDWLKHPLVNIVLGFILTGVLGTSITQHFMDQREQEKLRAQLAIDRKEAVQQFSKLNEERKVRADIMLKALRSSAENDEVKKAKQEYENAYVEWSVERPGTLLLFRDLLAPENYRLVESAFKENLVAKIFDPIRHCLTVALDQSKDKAVVTKTLDACGIDELLERSSTCSQALAAVVSDLAETSSEWGSKQDTEERQKSARDSIAKHCQ